MTITEGSSQATKLPTIQQIRRMTDDELIAHLENIGWEDDQAIEEFNDRNAEAQFDDEFDGPWYEVIDKHGNTFGVCSSRGHAEQLAECSNENVTLDHLAPFDVRES